MEDPFKNFECSVCCWYADHTCFHLEHTGMKVNPCDLCPEWKPIWEDV
jgi:hypothetical protein